MATFCEICGEKTNEVKSGGGIEPKEIVYIHTICTTFLQSYRFDVNSSLNFDCKDFIAFSRLLNNFQAQYIIHSSFIKY